MTYRDHQPITIEQFNGLWRRGDPDEVPLDHFIDGQNFVFRSSGIETRAGINIHQDVVAPLGHIRRIYNYVTQDKNTLLVLVQNTTTLNYEIYHVVDSITILGPILTLANMTDFAFVPYVGRAFISPFTTYGNIEKGLQNEYLYLYKGDGTVARRAGGTSPTTGSLTIVNGTGNTDIGFHLFAVLYETDTGFLTEPARFTGFTTDGTGVSVSNLPVSPESYVVARRLVATRVIQNYNGDTTGYTYYFIPEGRIANNTATFLNNISFFDADLLEEASHLIDSFENIAAGAALTIYHNRLCIGASYTDISLIRVSAKGEPESINEIDGLLIAPLDGNPITNLRELRDVLFGFKRNRTISWVDNGDVPSTWPMTMIDYGLGCPVHGIADVIDSGSANIDYLIAASYRGIVIFNGRYLDPELSWKIKDLWDNQDTTLFRRIQILNDTVNKIIYCALPDRRLLYGDYSNGLDPKKIKWSILKFDIQVNTIALVNTDDLIIGAERLLIE